MSSSKIIMVMAMIIMVFLAGGLLLGFIISTGGFLDKQSGRVMIDSNDAFQQMVFFNAVRAYQCDDRGGGYKDAWNSWQHYKQKADSRTDISFQDLKDAMPATSPELTCSGTPNNLPLSNYGGATREFVGGALDSLGAGETGDWGNDQQGRFGRIKFEINTSGLPTNSIQLGNAASPREGAFCHDGQNTDTVFIWSSPEDPSLSVLNQETNIDCVTFDNSDNSGHVSSSAIHSQSSFMDDKGPLIPVTLIGYDFDINSLKDLAPGDYLDRVEVTVKDGGVGGWASRNVPGASFITGSSGSKDFNVQGYPWTLCDEARGYIQTNVGGPASAQGPNSDLSNPGYTPQNPPGVDKEQPGDHPIDANSIHPFIVITDRGTYEPSTGICQ